MSKNNSKTQFDHSTGFLIASHHVSIRGLKFLGNPNPKVAYYYPISKEDPSLRDLEVSQCYFIGDKEAAKIQGGVWAHGPQNTVSHCIFYTCRNAVLFFNNVRDFRIEYSIFYGAYESAFWLGGEDVPFTFSHNIISHNTRFLVMPKDASYSSPFSTSVIANNEGFVGYVSSEEQKVLELADPTIELNKVSRLGKVRLQTNKAVILDKLHLHLTKDSEGVELGAGIF
ncbi:MAG: right-handed parallel beta-helix repeat-containing protein [Bacteroidota bacterium]